MLADRIDDSYYSLVGYYSRVLPHSVFATFVEDEIVVLGRCPRLDYGGGNVLEPIVFQHGTERWISLVFCDFVILQSLPETLVLKRQLIILGLQAELVLNALSGAPCLGHKPMGNP